MRDICIRCHGKGTYKGIGMITVDCNLCEDGYMINPIVHDKLPTIDKRSAYYKKAIKEIMDLNPEITKDEAASMFEESYNAQLPDLKKGD